MKRLLPAPLLSATLFVAWLMLNQSASAGNLALAAIFAVGLPLAFGGFRVDPPRIRRPAGWRSVPSSRPSLPPPGPSGRTASRSHHSAAASSER